MLTMLLRGPRRSADPTRTYYCLQGSWSLFHSLAFALTLLYEVQVVGLTPLQLVLVGTLLEVTASSVRSPPASWRTCTHAGSPS